MQPNNGLVLDVLFLEQDQFRRFKLFKVFRILLCILFLLYVDYRIMMTEWDDDLTLLEKSVVLQVNIIASIAFIFLMMEQVNTIFRRNQQRAELWVPYLITVLLTVAIYSEITRLLKEIKSGHAENGKNEWPKSSTKLGLFYALIIIMVVEWLIMSAILCYLVYQLISDFCKRQDACEKWFEAGHIKFAEYTRALFGDNSCLICNQELNDNDEMVQLRCSSSHIYHYNCIKVYVETGKNDCPTCGASIV